MTKMVGPLSCATNGFTAAPISFCPRKMVVTAQNDSIFDTPSSVCSTVPRMVMIQRMMPR